MSTHHMSKKSKPNDDVMFEYTGEDVPDNVTHARIHPNVTKIEHNAFFNKQHLKEVVFNNDLREIGNCAFFECPSLQSINIPSTVIKIGHCAFEGCSNLREVVLNEGLKEIGSDAFRKCTALRSITIPSTVKEIDVCAFIRCTGLTEVVLNEGLQKIEVGTFADCTSLESITLPSTLIEIGSESFRDCTNLRTVAMNDGMESITFPSTVIEIKQYAFVDCHDLREVVLYNERVEIGDKAFTDCTSLERFKFPRLSTRLENIIRAGQRGIEAKMDDIPAVEWRAGELIIPAVHREMEIEDDVWGAETSVEVDKEKLDKIVRLVRYYEIKEASTLFELALWKTKIDQLDDATSNRDSCRIEVPGPVKDAILKYL